MSQSQNEGVNNGEERLVEEEEEEEGEDFEAAYSRAQKEFTREAITNSYFFFCIFLGATSNTTLRILSVKGGGGRYPPNP